MIMIKIFGYNKATDIVKSSIGFLINKDLLLYNISITSVLGTISAFLVEYLGIEPVLFIAFMCLIVVEFLTGISASVVSGAKLQSRLLGRIVIKIIVYATVIFITHTYAITSVSYIKTMLEGLKWMIFYGIYLQLLLSIIENLLRHNEYKELSLVKIVLKTRIGFFLKEIVDFKNKNK